MKLSKENRDRITGKIEMIDYMLNYYCQCELPTEMKIHLKNLRYDLKTKIDAKVNDNRKS